jgi:serine/threonine protein kinase
MHSRLVCDAIPVRQLNPSVSPELEAIIAKAMQRDPNRRYTSARELSFDLTHPGKISVELPREIEARSKKVLFYSALAAIPGSILGLLLYVARHQ